MTAPHKPFSTRCLQIGENELEYDADLISPCNNTQPTDVYVNE